MTMSNEDLDRRFNYHPPNPDTAEMHDEIRANYRVMAGILSRLMPSCRELSTAVTKLEESMFWANAGIARRMSADSENGGDDADS